MLYESISLHATLKCEPPLESIAIRQRGLYVRRLLIMGKTEVADTAAYLSHCPNITTLALWSGDIDPTVLPLVEKLPLKCLSVDLCNVFDSPGAFRSYVSDGGGESVFSRITHFDIAYVPEEWEDWAILPPMRNLTHICLSEYPPATKIQQIIESCPNLWLLVILTQGNTVDRAIEQVSKMDYPDARVVECRVNGYGLDWLRGGSLVQGQESWEFAEQVVMNRALALRNGRAPSAGIRE